MSDEERDPLDPRAAMDLLGSTEETVQRRLGVDNGLLFMAWGLAWLIGYGAIWLGTRDQRPYTGPPPLSYVVLGLALALAGVVTLVTVRSGVRGLGGRASTTGAMYGFGWLAGFVLFECLLAAVAREDPPPEVMGLLGAGGPVLVVSIIYIVGAAIWLDWALFAMGAWLAAVTAVAVFFGPSTMCLILAVVGGGGFVVAGAALTARRVGSARRGGSGVSA